MARDFFFFSHRPFPAPPTAQEYTQAFCTYNKMTGCAPLKKNKKQKNSNQCMLWTGPSFCLWIYCILKYMKLRNSRIRHIRSTLQLTSFTPHFLQWKGYSCAEMRQCCHELNKSLKYSFGLHGENEQILFVTWSTCITTGQESTKPVFTTSENWEKKSPSVTKETNSNTYCSLGLFWPCPLFGVG